MSYILDALKKSEREKTLGQVPTLDTVISDGAKKKSSGTPWWLNLAVFFVALIAVLGIMKMAGLIDFPASENAVTQQPSQPLAPVNETDPNLPVSADADSESETPASGEGQFQVDQNPDAAAKNETSVVAAGEVPPEQLAEKPQPVETESEEQMPTGLNESGEIVLQADENSPEPGQDISPLESGELAALSVEPEAQSQDAEFQAEPEQEDSLSAGQPVTNIEQSSSPQYEEVLHDGLRDISVNVVSYSSNALQRFVMLDMTIYKEGDLLPNNALLMEITRTGAIVEFQNKRYMLKP